MLDLNCAPLTDERFRTIVAEVAIRRAERATAAGLPEHGTIGRASSVPAHGRVWGGR